MYSQSEDSFFFAEFLLSYFKKLKNKKISYLDMGSGSGILAETAKKSAIKNVLAADIDKESVDFIKKNHINSVCSDLFSSIKDKFDIITFNSPYLPEDKNDRNYDTSGGKKGDETAIRFIEQAKSHLNKNGKIFLLISSLTPLNRINKFNPKIVAKKSLFFEKLLILEFC